MNHFTGLEWVGYNFFPECTARVNKRFADYYVINYAHSGSLYWQMDNSPVRTLRAPIAWWTWPGPHYRFGYDGKAPWEHRFVAFRGSRVKKYISSGLFPLNTPVPFRPIVDTHRFTVALDDLLGYIGKPDKSQDRAVYMLEGILLQLFEQPVQVPLGNDRRQRISGLISEIRRSPRRQWDFKQQAEQASTSYTHLRRLFKSLTGQAPQQYVINLRLDLAAACLRKGKLPIKEIAGQAGYEDIYYFTKLFKNRFGLPPGRFRRESNLL